MANRYRVAVVGVGHMHVLENTGSFLNHPEFDVIGWADVQPDRQPICDKEHTRRGNLIQAEKWGQKVYADYRALLDEKPDIVLLCSENSKHAALGIEILSRGIHVVVEKPMALDYAGAKAMADEAQKQGVMLAVNWPSTWDPTIRAAQALAAEGAVGRIFKFVYRNSRSVGPLTYAAPVNDDEKAAEWWHMADQGGGAFYDYCCYGTNLASYILGERAQSAWAMRANVNHPFASADDNGVIVGSFPSGAFAILEGTWTTLAAGTPNGPLLFGLEGTLVADSANREVRVYKEKGAVDPTYTREAMFLPEDADSLAKVIYRRLAMGEPLHPTMDMPVNLNAMALLDAGLRACASGKSEATL